MISTALRLVLLLTLVTGIIYPLTVTALAQAGFPIQANGSLLADGSGSALVGQNFSDPRFFWGRPSATSDHPYDAASSSGSNLGPSEPKLAAAREAALSFYKDERQLPPADLLTASASGLDPHISPESARYQVPRVARARGRTEGEILALVQRFTEAPTFGVLGAARVNVLLLNRALDH